MFWGEYSHHLDNKGRLIIPARYRLYLAQNAILTRGIDHNLVIYPQETWQSVSDRLNQMSFTDSTARGLRRLLFSGAIELSLDRQGRVLIPTYLREYASLDYEALIVGMENFVEIWQPESWRKALDGVTSSLAEAESVLNLGL